ncbi:MAG: hypothetical protein ACJA08_001316 [Cyclobacteriaceae bacterium]|jgi:hypothetical protein
MKKAVLIFSLFFIQLFYLSATQMEVQMDDEATSEEPVEPEKSSKVILYSMTAVGVILIAAGVRRSKWGRKNK